jgi:TP901 family phage tail tape measure protein
VIVGAAEIELRPDASRFAQQAQGPLRGGLKSLAAVAAGAMAGVGLASLAKDAIGLEKTFSQTLNTMAAVANVPKASMKELSDLALDMGAKTVFSANESADAMLELAKGGLSAATIQAGALEGTLTLATAGGTDLATAATIAANALNTFGLAGKDMDAVAAALAGGANASTASIESLGEARPGRPGRAKNAGLSLQDTVGTLAAFDSAGIKGSDAGTSLKTMLTRLVPSTEKAASVMRGLGLDFTDAQGNFLPITEVAQQLQNALGDLSEEQRTQALSTIFGSDATRAATSRWRSCPPGGSRSSRTCCAASRSWGGFSAGCSRASPAPPAASSGRSASSSVSSARRS